MGNDQYFRAAVFLLFLWPAPVALYFRHRSQTTKEPLDRRQEGWFILATLRPVALVRMLGLGAYLINPAWMIWSHWELPLWLRWIGFPIGIMGGAMLIWTMRTLGPNLTDTVVTRREHTLVTDGPYRWVRHPFYAAAGLMLLGDSLLAANWFLALTGLMVLSLLVLRTDREEQRLVDRFGDDYRQYMRTTGRFFPRVRLSNS